jgi:hypothetical protein
MSAASQPAAKNFLNDDRHFTRNNSASHDGIASNYRFKLSSSSLKPTGACRRSAWQPAESSISCSLITIWLIPLIPPKPLSASNVSSCSFFADGVIFSLSKLLLRLVIMHCILSGILKNVGLHAIRRVYIVNLDVPYHVTFSPHPTVHVELCLPA